MEYIALIHRNTDSEPTRDEWSAFIERAMATDMFQGGSEIGNRIIVGNGSAPDTTQHVAGYMRFEVQDPSRLQSLLQHHPVIVHGGTIELCELPKSAPK